MRSATPEGLQQEALRPPVATHAAQPSGSAGRRTVEHRAWVRPVTVPVSGERGYSLIDPYVRRYWTAALGPSAVADLLRLGAAAERRRQIRRPHQLSVLLTEGLVARHGPLVLVVDRVPALPAHLARRLPARLRRELSVPFPPAEEPPRRG